MNQEFPKPGTVLVVVEHYWNDTDTAKLVGQQVIMIERHPYSDFILVGLNSTQEVTLHIKEVAKVVTDLVIKTTNSPSNTPTKWKRIL